MRSILDPLPRFLTVRGQALVVAMVVLGTAISVHEYLESSRPPERPRSCAGPASQGCPRIRSELRLETRASDRLRARSDAPAAVDSIEAPNPEPAPSAPSLWEPDELR